jgi:hypothetical protein
MIIIITQINQSIIIVTITTTTTTIIIHHHHHHRERKSWVNECVHSDESAVATDRAAVNPDHILLI